MKHNITIKKFNEIDEDYPAYVICDSDEYEPGDPDDYYIPDWTPDWLYDFLDSTGINYDEVAESIFCFKNQEDADRMINAVKKFNDDNQ